MPTAQPQDQFLQPSPGKRSPEFARWIEAKQRVAGLQRGHEVAAAANRCAKRRSILLAVQPVRVSRGHLRVIPDVCA